MSTDERTRVAIALLAAAEQRTPQKIAAIWQSSVNCDYWLRAADVALSFSGRVAIERRVPVCMTEGDNYLTVACSDGTIWSSVEAGKKWKELSPIPQPAASAPAADPVRDVWQPIATVPDDGHFDLWWGNRRFTGCYRDPLDGGWRHMTHFNQLIMVRNPSHWMAVPTAPLAEAKP